MSLGLQLGADVPFFIYGQNAFVEGIGEKIQGIELENRDFLVIFPQQGIATASIFQAPELTRDHAQITIDGFLASSWSDLSNDCQAVAMQICPQVKQALDWISHAVLGSEPRMSGSGSSVFAVLDPKTNAAKLENLLQNLPEGWVGRIVRGLNKNPAYNLISSEWPVGESPSWLRHWILIPACEGSNPSSPAKYWRNDKDNLLTRQSPWPYDCLYPLRFTDPILR